MINYTNVEIYSDSPISPAIKKGLQLLWSTPVGTVVLDRDFGVDMEFLDMPLPKAKQMYTIEVNKKTKKYEPRVKIENITFDIDALNGRLNPKVKIIEV